MFSHAIMFNNFFIACLTGQISFLDLHKLILNRQGCFIIQQCLFTITSYLFSNKLREFNVHMCPQIHLRGTRENNAFFNLPAEMWENAPLSALRSPRDTRRDTKLTLSLTKKNHAICFRSHKSLHYHPQGIFLKKRVCDNFILCVT